MVWQRENGEASIEMARHGGAGERRRNGVKKRSLFNTIK
jgi:hypothetical protein